MCRYGRRSWRPWLASLALDALSGHFHQRGRQHLAAAERRAAAAAAAGGGVGGAGVQRQGPGEAAAAAAGAGGGKAGAGGGASGSGSTSLLSLALARWVRWGSPRRRREDRGSRVVACIGNVVRRPWSVVQKECAEDSLGRGLGVAVGKGAVEVSRVSARRLCCAAASAAEQRTDGR